MLRVIINGDSSASTPSPALSVLTGAGAAVIVAKAGWAAGEWELERLGRIVSFLHYYFWKETQNRWQGVDIGRCCHVPNVLQEIYTLNVKWQIIACKTTQIKQTFT